MNILLFNFFLYSFWFSITFYKEKKITIYSILVLFYTIVAWLGFYTVSNGIYYDVFGYQSLGSLKLEPYLYTIFTYSILFWPLRNIKIDDRYIDIVFSKGHLSFVKGWIVYFSLYTLLKLVEAIASLSLGLGDVYDARHNDGSDLFVYNNILLEKFNGYGYFLLNATVPFIMAYMFISVNKKRMSYSYASFLILLCFFPSILSGIAMGSRGGGCS